MESNLVYASAGGIRTYPYLLDDRNTKLMHLMFMFIFDMHVRGWMTVSGCTRDAQVSMISTLNGGRRQRLSWTVHLAVVRIERDWRSVPVASVQIGYGRTRRPWLNMFS